jgi:chromosome segregation ATPase
MPDEVFHNEPSNIPASAPPVSTEASLTEPMEEQRLEVLFQEVRRLRSRLGLLSGIAAIALLLAAALAGVVISMKQQLDRQAQQVGLLTGNKAGAQDQINSLNQQVSVLNQKLASSDQQLSVVNQQLAQKVSQAQLKPLISIVQDINSKAVTRDQLNAALQRVQPQKSNSEGRTQTILTPFPSTAPSP